MKQLEEEFKNMHLLGRDERLALTRELELLKPDFMKPYLPKWYWWRRCTVKVLIVTDGGLDFSTNGFGLSEFLTTFNQLQATTWNNYQLTLGHRSSSVLSSNPLVVNQINSFNFQTSVTLSDFDQVWLFGINSGTGLPAPELAVVDAYMNGGGGLFATGDHGSLGSSLCGNIPRVKDMRYWASTSATNSIDEVSMSGARRNDTNRPRTGDATSLYFDNQSDNVPQTIAARTFSNGHPHPLLSISTSIRPSGVIDIMPDHPHEGECKPESVFTVNNMAIQSQIIATSFVLSGSTTNGGNGGKTPTIPHCFPSIAVWDGRPANVGRIVVDSTWHHFVNINLNGVGSGGGDIAGTQSGLTTADFNVVRQYFMNIATWMTRRKTVLCWKPYLIAELHLSSSLIEASLDNPKQKLQDISLGDLNSIGSLAEEILSTKYNPAFAREFLLDLVENQNREFANALNSWKPEIGDNKRTKNMGYYHSWINLDLILWTAVGTGFIALRDDKRIESQDFSDKDLESLMEVFSKGVSQGLEIATKDLGLNLKSFSKEMKFKL
jgi:hypothetical protein